MKVYLGIEKEAKVIEALRSLDCNSILTRHRAKTLSPVDKRLEPYAHGGQVEEAGEGQCSLVVESDDATGLLELVE